LRLHQLLNFRLKPLKSSEALQWGDVYGKFRHAKASRNLVALELV